MGTLARNGLRMSIQGRTLVQNGLKNNPGRIYLLKVSNGTPDKCVESAQK